MTAPSPPQADSESSGREPRIGPGTFLAIGVALFALKFVTDRLIATLVFGRSWSVFNYLIPFEAYALWQQSGRDRVYYATMLLAAAPFVIVGVVVTLRRLRDAELPDGLVALFFVPAVNLVFFTVLSVIPTRRRAAAYPAGSAGTPPEPPLAQRVATTAPLGYGRDELDSTRRFLSRWLPVNRTAAGIVAVLGPVPFAIGVELLSVYVLRGYGFGLFLAMPFVLGFTSVLIYGARVRRPAGECWTVALLSLLVSGGCMITFALEGLGCLIMLAPLAIPIALIGAGLGYSIQSRLGTSAGDGTGRLLISAVAMVPLLTCGEALVRPAPTVFAVTTVVEIDAPPQRVWQHVVHFRDIDRAPAHWIFRAGVAYPVRARIDGAGVGATRYCEFSTGTFVEPIEVWDEPRLLRFAVVANAPPMREWSPFHIHPPHLDNFLVSHAGQFRLIPLPAGRTRLEGTTWYEHRMWPEAYWRWWSDYVIHRIHGRVLDHVRALAEHPE